MLLLHLIIASVAIWRTACNSNLYKILSWCSFEVDSTRDTLPFPYAACKCLEFLFSIIFFTSTSTTPTQCARKLLNETISQFARKLKTQKSTFLLKSQRKLNKSISRRVNVVFSFLSYFLVCKFNLNFNWIGHEKNMLIYVHEHCACTFCRCTLSYITYQITHEWLVKYLTG